MRREIQGSLGLPPLKSPFATIRDRENQKIEIFIRVTRRSVAAPLDQRIENAALSGGRIKSLFDRSCGDDLPRD
jgi:hypothetical protein